MNSENQNLLRLRELTERVLLPSPMDISRIVCELLADGIAIIDSEGIIVYVSPLLQTLFGYGSKELLGHPIEILVPKEKRAGHIALRNNFLKAGTDMDPRRMDEGLILTGEKKCGDKINLRVGLSPLDWEGDNHGAIAVVQQVK